jgi:hypothetical protein
MKITATVMGPLTMLIAPQNTTIARRVAWPHTYRRPSTTSRTMSWPPLGAWAWRGLRTKRSVATETRNVAASIARVGAGPMRPTSTPAIAGPTRNARLKNASLMDAARPTMSRPTRFGMAAVQPDSQKTRRRLIGAVTRRMTAIVGRPSQKEIGMSAVRRPRPRSA